MSDVEFFQTKMGREFYDSTMPRIAEALEQIAAHLVATNARLHALPRFDVVSRWHDHLDFQNRDVYRMVGEVNPEGEWVRWADVLAAFGAPKAVR